MEVPPRSLKDISRHQRNCDDAASGIPTILPRGIARNVRHMDPEELSGQLAAEISLPEVVDHDAAANTLLAIMRQPWSEASTEARAMIINFSQRVLDEMGLEVRRQNG